MVRKPSNKAVFLDRDGVLIQTNIINNKPFAITDHKKLNFLNGVKQGLKILKSLDYLLIVVTNQPDVITKKTPIKEMDLILGGFADNEMSKLSIEELNEHELMMSENDHDLYNWVSGKSEIPPELLSAINRITNYFLKNK